MTCSAQSGRPRGLRRPLVVAGQKLTVLTTVLRTVIVDVAMAVARVGLNAVEVA